jgi:hypothetical protein
MFYMNDIIINHIMLKLFKGRILVTELRVPRCPKQIEGQDIKSRREVLAICNIFRSSNISRNHLKSDR